MKKGDNDRAIADCTKAIELDSDSYNAYHNRGRAYHNRGTTHLGKENYDKAIANFTIALEQYSRAVDAAKRSVSHLSAGVARPLANITILLIETDLAPAYFARAGAYADKGDYDNAIASYTQGIALKPNNYLGYMVRGGTYFEKGDYNNAIADYTQAIKLDPTNYIVYNLRGTAYQQKATLPGLRQILTWQRLSKANGDIRQRKVVVLIMPLIRPFVQRNGTTRSHRF